MITQAKIKNVINDFNGITAAVSSYQDRYRALPGDDLNASSRWAGSSSGNGDGQWDLGATLYNNTATAAVGAKEVNLFWWHLRLAGFVAGTTAAQVSSVTQPANAANGIMGVQTGGMGFTSNIVCSSNLPDKIAIPVDTQIDDGTGATGQVWETLQSSPNQNPAPSSPTDVYAETGTNQYLLCKTCKLQIFAGESPLRRAFSF